MKKILKMFLYIFHYILILLLSSMKKSGVVKQADSPVTNILLIQLNAIGDLLMTSPAINSIFKRYPSAKIDICVLTKNLKTVYLLQHKFDYVYHTNTQSFFSILKSYIKYFFIFKKYDIIIDFTGSIYSAYLTKLASLFSKTTYTTGFSKSLLLTRKSVLPRFHSLYTHSTEPNINLSLINGNYIMHNLNTLTLDVGAQPNSDYTITLPEQAIKSMKLKLLQINKDNKPLILVHPGTKWQPKLWPATYWVELLNQLISLDKFNLILATGEFEKKLRPKLLKEVPGIIDLRTDIFELAACVYLSCLVISLDSVTMHLAYALRKKYIALFGPVSPKQSGYPDYVNGKHLYSNLYCSPCELYYKRDECERGRNYCMIAIKPEMIVDAIKNTLNF
ncbi:MAG: glycosyltransferase family 9 protein [Candidatus Hydrogenedentota bacterium]